MQNLKHVQQNAAVYSKVKSIKKVKNEDVYCITVPKTGNFAANGIVIKNCDSLRYSAFSHFGKKENLYEKDRSQIFIENENRKFNQNPMAYPGFPGQIGWQVVPNQFM